MSLKLSAIERMSVADRIAFGRAEMQARKDDLVQVHAGTLTLQDAQKRARDRRKPLGLTANQAFALLRDHHQMKEPPCVE